MQIVKVMMKSINRPIAAEEINVARQYPVQSSEKRASLIASLGETRINELISLVPAEIEKVLLIANRVRQTGARKIEDPIFASLELEAHGLKGVALNYGLLRLAYCASALQEYCRTSGDIDVHLSRLQECSKELTDIAAQ